MSFVAIFSGSYCHGDEIAARVAEQLGYERIDQQVLLDAAAKHGATPERLLHCMEGPASLLDAFRRDRPRNLAYVRESLAEWVAKGGAVYHGFGLHLLPKSVSHVLKVCLVGSRAYRTTQAMKALGVTEKKARKQIESDDAQRVQWTQHVFDLGPWDERLYDEIIPVHSLGADEAVRLIETHARGEALKPTGLSRSAAADFLLAARVEVAIAREGHEVKVTAADGNVTLIIDKYVMRVEALEAELKRIAGGVGGVKSATTRLGPKFRPPGIHRDLDFGPPGRILLVDDEKEFVHTLSERLEARDLETAVAYDGEDALSFVESHAPEVMVLDLKMPGIDGLEVLRRVKKTNPEVEVIILTGHGSELEQRRAEELGAFAYLNKPVDIELLARTMREAYARVADRKAAEALLAGTGSSETQEPTRG